MIRLISYILLCQIMISQVFSLKRTKKAVDRNYFGPFVSSEVVKKSIKEIQKIYKVRNCSDTYLANRTRPYGEISNEKVFLLM